MSFRGRPSLSGTPGRSRLETSPSKVDISQLRSLLQTTRDLPCFQTHPECQDMIDDVLTKCLPVAAAASESERTGPSSAGGYSTPAAPNFPYIPVDSAEHGVDLNRKQHEMGLFSPSSVLPTPRKGDGGVLSTPRRGSLFARKASGSGFVEKIGITRIPDRAWTIALDYLDLGEGMRCRQLGRLFRDIVESSLSVLALSGVKSITWATPENLSFLTRFKNVRTLHWYVGVGRLTEPEEEGDAAGMRGGDETTEASANGGGEADSLAEGSRKVARGECLSVAECNPVRAWAYLLGALPKLEEVIIVEGLETDESALEEVWLHLLPLCRNLRSFFLNFEDYSECPVDGDHPPINVKKFAVFLQAKRPFPKLRELHLELGSMSIAEQRSLIRGLSMSGLLPQLEKVTLGDGTTSYIRNPGRGPGRDLYTAFKRNPCTKLKVLWLQRLDLWDDLDALAVALSPKYCPVLEELFLDLALDTDDVVRLAKSLHKFPDCLKTLGVLAVAIKDRTTEGNFTNNDPTPALQMLADALANHPRPYLQCLDISLHFELPQPEPEDHQSLPEQTPFEAKTSVAPIMLLIESGKLTGLKHVQLSGCSLDDAGLLVACNAVAGIKGIQTLDLSSNRLSKEGAKQLAKALWRCRSLHEIVLEESVEEKDSEEVSQVFKEYMPWATVRLDDRDSRRSFARRSAASHVHFDDDTDDQDGFMDDDDNDDSQASDQGHPHHWDAVDAESDGEVPLELMTDDSDEEM